MNCFGWQPCSYQSLFDALIWRHVGKPQVPWNPTIPTLGHFWPTESSAKKDVMHSLIERPISSRAHVNLQFQVINPTHIGPSNGCLTINRPACHFQPDFTKRRKENGFWTCPHICDLQIFMGFIGPTTFRTKHTLQALTETNAGWRSQNPIPKRKEGRRAIPSRSGNSSAS